ncbi:MAG: UDP-2,4-diacetamido-2,4,6-trideoxy-beta-L-altropyranose hydrolase [Actinomycetota bacterium]|nr:UDP-2,4-diacetamido-2,4,6-trideoxy-beta-L-altropyranose hydrolase [Actinomycetota bacterium]
MTSSGAGEHSARLLVRADGGRSIGSGHIVRSLTLAGLLKQRGMHAVFAIRDDRGTLIDRIRSEGHDVLLLTGEAPSGSFLSGSWPTEAQQSDVEKVISRSSSWYGAVIVDHYGLDAHWERGIRTLSDRVLAMDDLANRSHDVDVLVDHNWYGPDTSTRYDDLVPPSCVQLLGPRYAPLQAAYAEARARMSSPEVPPRRILVSFGGSDPTGETLKVVDALSAPEFRDLAVDVVLGTGGLLTDRLRDAIDGCPGTTLHVALPTLADMLQNADLSIGASGAATWERACLGVPGLVTTTSEAHSGVTRALAEAGMTTWAGIGGEVTTTRYRELLHRIVAGEVGHPLPLVDGHGAARVAEALRPSDASDLTIRTATELDAPLFLGVDSGGPPDEPRQLDGPDAWLREEARFGADMRRSDRVLLVAMLGPVQIGRARARLMERTIEVSFILDDLVAGRELGLRVASYLRRARWSIRGEQLSYLGLPVGTLDEDPRGGINGVGPLFGSTTVPAGSIVTET